MLDGDIEPCPAVPHFRHHLPRRIEVGLITARGMRAALFGGRKARPRGGAVLADDANMQTTTGPMIALVLILAATAPALAQHEAHEQGMTMQMPTGHEQHSDDPGAMFLMQQSSGTSTQPSAWPMPMLMGSGGPWQLGAMGQAFVVFTGQSGPRGDDGAYSVNWLMGSASRPLGSGRVQFRAMLSLEPATVPDRRYPLLFQTGETAYGMPIVDGQHPHDFLMELSVQYVRPLGRAGLLDVYYAPVGDPAMGPVAFPHRASAFELPQAALGHHWQDSTHIADNVVTLGWARGGLRLEASAFRGAEPDEQRWDLDFGAMDSWSVRGSVAPTDRWMGQVSFAHLHQPEATHPGDVDRTTASMHYVVRRTPGPLAASVIWATNRKSVERTNTHAVTFETAAPLTPRDTFSARVEWSQRDELFAYDHDLEDEIEEQAGTAAFPVTALTLAYTRDVVRFGRGRIGLGASVSRYWADDALAPYYGGAPWGVSVFLRARLERGK